MQCSSELQVLLNDLDDDEGLAGNVWSDTVTAMERAWEQLHDYSAGARGVEALRRAAEEVQRGVALMDALHQRLERLEAEEATKAHNCRQAPQPIRMRWVSR